MEPSKLYGLHKDVKRSEYILDTDVYTLGRYAKCQVVVRRATVSRLHAKIERDGPRYVLSDTNSANGTFVNGRRIYQPHVLADEDEIGLGSAEPLLRFEDPETTLYITVRLRFDEAALTFFLNKEPVELTAAQFQLLYHLYQHAGNICTRESCAEAIWGREYDPDLDARALDRAINKLRQRLREIDPQADLLKTHRGLGYSLHP